MGQLDVCGNIALGVVGRCASGDGTCEVSLSCVSLNVVPQSHLDMELLPTSWTLIILVVSTAFLLAVLPSLQALECFSTIRAERTTIFAHKFL